MVSNETEAPNQDLEEGNERVSEQIKRNTNWGIVTCEPTLREIPRTYKPGKRSGLTHTVSKLARPVRQARLSLSLLCNDPEMVSYWKHLEDSEVIEWVRIVISDGGLIGKLWYCVTRCEGGE
ncbi:hypothetical protein E2C01_014776 [Portunus trituberculatus]|uniref:Uncharacterized protein n=1 Tax=Portunus trituberculatus TaxID=210409 RepID=A0A5B7DJN5_PORTR|nr:hypothetical protein [Portunus trituberculatus]